MGDGKDPLGNNVTIAGSVSTAARAHITETAVHEEGAGWLRENEEVIVLRKVTHEVETEVDRYDKYGNMMEKVTVLKEVNMIEPTAAVLLNYDAGKRKWKVKCEAPEDETTGGMVKLAKAAAIKDQAMH